MRGCLIALLVSATLCGCYTMEASDSVTVSRQKKMNISQAAELNVELGLAYMTSGNADRAKQKLLLAQSQAPDHPLVLNALARFYGSTGQKDEARKYYQKALALYPNSSRTHNNYGVFLCKTGAYSQAVKEFIVAANDPRYLSAAEAYENAGLCALKIPDTGQAKQYFDLSLQRDGRRSSVILEQARLAYQGGLYQSAQTYLDRFHQLAPTSITSLELGVKVAQQLGNKHALVKQKLLLNAKREKLKQSQSENS